MVKIKKYVLVLLIGWLFFDCSGAIMPTQIPLKSLSTYTTFILPTTSHDKVYCASGDQYIEVSITPNQDTQITQSSKLQFGTTNDKGVFNQFQNCHLLSLDQSSQLAAFAKNVFDPFFPRKNLFTFHLGLLTTDSKIEELFEFGQFCCPCNHTTLGQFCDVKTTANGNYVAIVFTDNEKKQICLRYRLVANDDTSLNHLCLRGPGFAFQDSSLICVTKEGLTKMDLNSNEKHIFKNGIRWASKMEISPQGDIAVADNTEKACLKLHIVHLNKSEYQTYTFPNKSYWWDTSWRQFKFPADDTLLY